MKNFGLKGHFDIVKKKADGSIVEQYSFDNLILNSGLDLVGLYDDVLAYCHLGTGNSVPDINQTALDNHIASEGHLANYRTEFNLSGDEKSLNIVKKAVFGAGKGTGNIAEIGMSHSDRAGQSLFCRTLIKDSQGRPTVISKLKDEILEVFYTLKVIINHQDVTGVGLIDGEEYNYIMRPAYLGIINEHSGVWSGSNIADITGYPAVTTQYQPVSRQQYNTGSHQFFYTMFASIDAITIPVRSVMFRGLFKLGWQCQFSKKSDGSAIPKDRTKTLSLKFKVSWGRA